MRTRLILVVAAGAFVFGASEAAARPPAHASQGAAETFGAQVRVIAHGQHEAQDRPGIGKTVSEMAHQKSARAESRVTATIVDEKPGKGRGRGR